MVDPIISKGLQGIQLGVNNAVRDVQRVADAFNPDSSSTENPVDPLIALKLDQHQVEASTKVVKVAKTLNDSILDILA